MAGQRTNYLSWDEYFISAVGLASLRSVQGDGGACIVDMDHRILSIGSNQVPYSLESKIPKIRIPDYTLDSVSNALFNFKGKRSEFLNGTIYVSEFPTPEQAKNIAQAKLQKVVYFKDVKESEEKDITRYIFDKTSIYLEKYIDSGDSEECYYSFLKDLQDFIKKNLKQRDGRVTPEEYYMSMAVLATLRSKDPSTQVGSCLVDENGRVVSVGYNGAPQGMEDRDVPWHSNGEKTGKKKDVKDYYSVHAEVNTLDNYRGQQDDLNRMRMYVTLSPCSLCTPRISVGRPREIVWLREFEKINFEEYEKWFAPVGTECHSYNNKSWSKSSYKELVEEATKIIKKNIGKPGKM